MQAKTELQILAQCMTLQESRGTDHQFSVVQEECGELVSAVSKHRRGRIDSEALASEAVDVLLMSFHIRAYVGETVWRRVFEEKLAKLMTVEERL
jgi:NTP pyrophosphatase (non-canonical NTP hydrolase)